MSRTIIIAEAGVNHNGDIILAKKLIDAAKEAGVDYVKFQTFKTELSITKYAEKADYQKDTTEKEESQFEMIKKLELNKEQFVELSNYCNLKKVKFLSTAFDLESIDFLNELEMDFFKIPSGEITNYPYLKKIAQIGLAVVMSTGMADLVEIGQAVEVLLENGLGKHNITILHCNTEYPTPVEDVNLNAMQTISETFNVKVGYSDHTPGLEIPLAAVARGASIIEKHFTLNRNMSGPDHQASLEPDELKQMVRLIRNVEKAMGDGGKRPSKSEIKNIAVARKSIVAKTKISKGDIFSEENICVKRPGSGISPMKWNEIIGTISKQDYKEDDLI